MILEVLDPGLITTVQDAGRNGFERFGVPVAGAMDWFALRAGNLLVGNAASSAGLEFAGEGPTIRCTDDMLVAVTGCGFIPEVDGQLFPAWLSIFLRRGSILQMRSSGPGLWGYITFCGGLDVPSVLGSRSTYLRGGFGGLDGRILVTGDQIRIGHAANNSSLFAGRSLAPRWRPAYQVEPVLRVIPGPQEDNFPADGRDTFYQSQYRLSDLCDRMGYRLTGPLIAHQGAAGIISEGTALGSVQVPADGQPLIMMSDRQATGGYAKIGVIATADIPLLAQCQPGVSQVRFQPAQVEACQQAYRALLHGLTLGFSENDELAGSWF